MSAPAASLLKLTDLSVSFKRGTETVTPIRNLSLSIAPGETVALVGESGSGKSVTSLAVLGLLHGASTSGSILWNHDARQVQLLGLSSREMKRIRGNQISMIFQEPMTSLNPVQTVGDQIAEAARLHNKISRRSALMLAQKYLSIVGISDAEERIRAYPHELSGGMRQRVMIAMSLVCNPALLIADEPTTALDVTIQAQILELLLELKNSIGMSMLFISHDFGVVADIADTIAVMYAGEVVEIGPAEEILRRPIHPYTRALLGSIPKVSGPKGALNAIKGSIPELNQIPKGCTFAPRCAHVRSDRCTAVHPGLETAGNSEIRCVRWRELGHA